MFNRRIRFCGTFACFTIICSALASLVSCQDCSTDRYDSCTNAFKAGDPSNAVVPWYSKVVLIDICSRLQALTECMHTVVPYCSASKKLIYQGVVSGYNFLCNTGYDEYIAYQGCYSDASVQREGTSCVTTYNSMLNAVFNNSAYDDSYKRARLCQYSNTYIACIGYTLKSLCNSGAASWQETFDTKQLCPLLSGVECPGWTTKCPVIGSSTSQPATASAGSSSSSSLSTSVLALLVCLVVVALILIIGTVAIVVMCRLRPHRARTVTAAPVIDVEPAPFGDFGPTRIELPPPYPGPFTCRELFSSSPGEENSRPVTTSQTRSAASGASRPSHAADNEAFDAPEIRAHATVKQNGGLDGEDGFFVPESVDIPPTSLSGNRHFADCDFIPDDDSDSYEHMEAAMPSSTSSASPPVSFPHQHDHRRFQLHHPHQRHQRHHHDRYYEPGGGSHGSRDVTSRSSRSTPSVDRQVQFTSGRESEEFGRIPDVSTPEVISGNARDASVGSMYSGTISASAHSTSPLVHPMSANTSMTSSNLATSPASYDSIQPSDDDIDYY